MTWAFTHLWFGCAVDNYNWAHEFRELFEDGLASYRAGRRDAKTMFDSAQKEFLAGLGATTHEIFDFVEDHFHGGDPGAETALLITAVRRDYFKVVQKGLPSPHRIDMARLPAKSAALDGIAWLPRLIAKARAKLRGEMPPELMYDCGGDRAFLREHGIHPADLLREVWAAKDDTARILHFVRAAASAGPAEIPAGPASFSLADV